MQTRPTGEGTTHPPTAPLELKADSAKWGWWQGVGGSQDPGLLFGLRTGLCHDPASPSTLLPTDQERQGDKNQEGSGQLQPVTASAAGGSVHPYGEG